MLVRLFERTSGGAPELRLVAQEPEVGDVVLLGGLKVHLDQVVLEDRLVRGLVEPYHIGHVLAVLAVGPELVPDDGTAEVDAPVGDVIDAVALVATLEAGIPLELGWDVFGLQRFVGPVEHKRTAIAVGAALRHEAHVNSTGRSGDVGATRRDVDLVKGVIRIVGR